MKKTLRRTRILIVDDHPAVREALAARIGRHADLEVCGEAVDIADALSLVRDAKPDVAVIDISLKTGNGIDLIKRILDRTDAVRILVWSTHSESLYAERVLRAGGLGYIQKDQATDKIIEAIRRVLEGKVYLSDAMKDKLLTGTVGADRNTAAHSLLDRLADRELEVLRLIGEGLKTARIADRMHLSIHTIETYRERIKTKLDLKSSTELACFATQWVLENR